MLDYEGVSDVHFFCIGGKNIMLDCGMHMGFSDDRRFPDFTYIAQGDYHCHIDGPLDVLR